MAQEDVVVRYRAEVDELTRQLKIIADQQQKLAEGQNKVQKELGETSTASRKLATDVNTAGKSFQKAATDSKGFSGAVKKELSSMVPSVQNIGIGIASGIAAAFSVQAVINFGKASIDAFLEAEKSAQKLQFAITQINGETEEAFERLIKQSNQLQKTTTFSDESIQAAQTALATFGLTSDQIEKLIPQLADFATATKRDIAEAATIAGQGIVGMGRELNRLGIEVSASNTRMENLSILTQGFGKFAGAAADGVKTLSGQLENQALQVDELQEQVGSQLAPAWVKVKKAIFEATLALISYSKVNQTTRQDLQQIAEDSAKLVVAEAQARGKSNQEIIASLNALVALNQKEKDALELNLQLRTRSGELSKGEARVIKDQIALKQGLIDGYKAEAAAIQSNIDLKNRELSVEQIRLFTTEQLNKALEENKKINDIVGKSNVELLEKEIALRKKLGDEAAKQAAKDAEAAAQDRVKQIEDTTQAGLNSIGAFKKIGDEKGKIAAKNRADQEKEAKDLADRLAKIGQGEVDKDKEQKEQLVQQRKDANEQILQNSAALVSELSALFTALGDSQIQEIERVRERRLEDIDEELETLTDQRESKLINEEDYETRSAQLKQKRVDAEKKATDEINKIKKRQAILDKLAAIFQIIINTQQAMALVSTTIPFPASAPIIALLQALGAAQIATVVATAIPKFEKGTKRKKGASLAMVGEKGPEVTYLPDQAKVLPAKETKTYGKVLDAMFDNNLDRYVHKTYVAPALIKQKEKHEAQQQMAFAQNISNSFAVQNIGGMDEYGMRRALNKPLTIRKESAEYIGKAIAEQLKPDYRKL